MDEKQLYAVVHRPPNVPEAFTATFADLWGKAFAVYHHCARVAELEERDRERLRDSLSAVLSIGNVITVARTASATLRVEFEALLSAGYSLLNVLSRAVSEVMLGRDLEGERRLPTLFGPRSLGLRGFLETQEVSGTQNELYRRVTKVLADLEAEGLPDIVSAASPRHRIVHREHLRCRPAQASVSPFLRVRVPFNDPLNPTVENPGPPIPGLSITMHGVPDVGFCDYIVTASGEIPREHLGEMRLVPAGEIGSGESKSLSLRAREFGEAHMLAVACVLEAITLGEDWIDTIVTRRDAALRAFGAVVQ